MTESSISIVVYFALGVVLAVFLARKLMIIPEGQRVAVVQLGNFVKLLRPGLNLKWSGRESAWLRISLGQIGRYLGGEMAEFQGTPLPVKFTSKPGRGVVIERFEGNEIWGAGADVTIVRCEKCGYANEVAA